MFKKLFEMLTGNDAADATKPIEDAVRNAAQEHVNKGKHDFEEQNSPAYQATQGANIAGFEKEDLSHPLLQPVSGISFRDYAAMTVKMTAGALPEEVYKAMESNEAAYAEASKEWIERLQTDASGTLAQLYGKYYAEADKHPKLQNLTSTLSAEGQANLTKLKTDRYYYYEMEGARDAATAAGLNVNDWVLEKFGIPFTEFQAAFAQWLVFQNQNWDKEELTRLIGHRQEKQKEYAAKIASGQL